MHQPRRKYTLEKSVKMRQKRRYGWGSFKPDCLQFLNRPIMLLVFITVSFGFVNIAQDAVTSGTYTSLERRYKFTALLIGILASIIDFCLAFITIPITFWTSKRNRSTMIALGLNVAAVGYVVYLIPYFVTPYYDPRDDSGSYSFDPMLLFGIFICGQMISGVGLAICQPLFPPYIHDNAPENQQSLYIAIYMAFGNGVFYMLGMLMTGAYLSIPIDLVQLDGINQDHPKFIGAWWLSFLTMIGLLTLVSIPVSGFPQRVKQNRKSKTRSLLGITTQQLDAAAGATSTADVKLAMSSLSLSLNATEEPVQSMKEMLKDLLLVNKSFGLLMGVCCCHKWIVKSVIAFLVKFYEQQFGFRTTSGNLVMALLLIPMGVFGQIIAGIVLNKTNMTVKQTLFGIFLSFLFMLPSSAGFLLHCSYSPFAGVDVPYPETVSGATSGPKTIDLLDSCNLKRNCSQSTFDPVCIENLNYYSSCYAGCDENSMNITVCDCVTAGMTYVVNHTVDGDLAVHNLNTGFCDRSCSNLYIHFVLFAIVALFYFISDLFIVRCALDLVKPHQKAFGKGIMNSVQCMFATVPAPVFFGSMIDMTCVEWSTTQDHTGDCLWYDAKQLGLCFFLICVVPSTFGAIFSFLSYLFYFDVNARDDTAVVIADELVNPVPLNGVSPIYNSALNEGSDGRLSDDVFKSSENLRETTV